MSCIPPLFDTPSPKGNLIWVLTIVISFLGGCSTTPAVTDRPYSSAYRDPDETTLGRLARPHLEKHPDLSGFLILDAGSKALEQRLALLDSAERSFDAQYYIWNSDLSGRYMAGRVLHAARRGVKVRLLIDDWTLGGRDKALLAMDDHRNIEVRVFNPTRPRSVVGKSLAFLGDFDRLNRRMHNKSFTVDGSITIVGGRNIGDEYFDLHPTLNFRDRDLLVAGPIVERVSNSFDAFWNSQWARPISAVAKDTRPADEFRKAQMRLLEESVESPAFSRPADNTGDQDARVSAILDDAVWAQAQLVFDEPDDPDRMMDTDRRMPVAVALGQLVRDAREEVLIESAYLVLGDEQLVSLDDVKSRGVRVSALTNSLASNDVVPNHAAYARRRPSMLAHGLEIRELRPDPASCPQIIQSGAGCGGDALLGLHAKSMVFDRKILYVGSSNVNLRSIYLNFEIALVVFSSELADRVATAIERDMRLENSWHVKQDADGIIEWVGSKNGQPERWTTEPNAGLWKRMSSGLWSLFPLEKYL